MHSLPLLALTGVLGVLLTACPGGGPGFSFTGTYSATVGTRDAARLPEAFRVPVTLTFMLTQTGMNISGSYTSPGAGPPIGNAGTIMATVGAAGEATGALTPTMPPGPAVAINFRKISSFKGHMAAVPVRRSLPLGYRTTSRHSVVPWRVLTF